MDLQLETFSTLQDGIFRKILRMFRKVFDRICKRNHHLRLGPQATQDGSKTLPGRSSLFVCLSLSLSLSYIPLHIA